MAYILVTRFKDAKGLIHLGHVYTGFETVDEARLLASKRRKVIRTTPFTQIEIKEV